MYYSDIYLSKNKIFILLKIIYDHKHMDFENKFVVIIYYLKKMCFVLQYKNKLFNETLLFSNIN